MRLSRPPLLLVVALMSVVFAAWSINHLDVQRVVAAPVDTPTPGGTLAATGIVEPTGRTSRLGASATGLVTRVLVAVGDAVTAGQPLLEQDRRVALATVAYARAEVERLQALPRVEDLAQAEATLAVAVAQDGEAQARRDEARALTEPGALSAAERDRRERTAQATLANRAAAQAARDRVAAGAWDPDLRVARAELQRAEAMAELLITRAPQSGTVLQVNARLGEPADPLATVPLLVIGDTSGWRIRAALDEELLPRLRAGDATAHVRGAGGRAIPLRWLASDRLLVPKTTLTGNPSERADTRVLEILFDIAIPDHGLVAGQVVDVRWNGP